MTRYVALIHRARGTSLGVVFPDFPGCVSSGSTLDEAVRNGAEALALHVAGMREDGARIPKPRTLAHIRAAKEDWLEWKDTAATMIPLLPLPQRAVRLNVSLDRGLARAIDHAAKRRGMTRSGFLTEAARRLLLDVA
jgi:predicted RNase H-like HicB family nuclease